MYTYMNELLLPTTLLQQNTVKQDTRYIPILHATYRNSV